MKLLHNGLARLELRLAFNEAASLSSRLWGFLIHKHPALSYTWPCLGIWVNGVFPICSQRWSSTGPRLPHVTTSHCVAVMATNMRFLYFSINPSLFVFNAAANNCPNLPALMHSKTYLLVLKSDFMLVDIYHPGLLKCIHCMLFTFPTCHYDSSIRYQKNVLALCH